MRRSPPACRAVFSPPITAPTPALSMNWRVQSTPSAATAFRRAVSSRGRLGPPPRRGHRADPRPLAGGSRSIREGAQPTPLPPLLAPLSFRSARHLLGEASSAATRGPSRGGTPRREPPERRQVVPAGRYGRARGPATSAGGRVPSRAHPVVAFAQ